MRLFAVVDLLAHFHLHHLLTLLIIILFILMLLIHLLMFLRRVFSLLCKFNKGLKLRHPKTLRGYQYERHRELFIQVFVELLVRVNRVP